MAETSVAPEYESDVDGAVVLDPEYSERQYYRDPFTGYQREIWRPGDADGSQITDYYGRTGPPLPVESRWRLFQSNIGPIGIGAQKAEPPRFVFLDDRAAYEVLHSDIQRTRLTREWPHDFAASGKIRPRRSHCGRPAVKDSSKPEYHSCNLSKTLTYYFTGEKDYKPIIYRIPPPQKPEPTVEELMRKRKAEEDADPALYNARAHGHNQYTPKDMMVKHGAPTFSRKKTKSSDESPLLATLKALTPSMHLQRRSFAEDESRSGSSKAGSVRSRSETGGSKVASVASKATRSEVSNAITTTEPIGNMFGSGEDSESDVELFPGQTSTRRSVPTSPIATGPDTSRQMDHNDRRAQEQALAREIMDAVHSQDDVMRIARELAEAKVALADQANEIDRLQKALGET